MKENKIYCMIDIGKTKSNKPGIATSPAITTNNHHQTDLFSGRITVWIEMRFRFYCIYV